MPTLVAELDTPAVVIDLDIVEANIKRAQDILASHRLNNRPHIKTHKIPALAKKQIEAGAVGITCQKLGEVEVMADAGVADDILLTYNVLGDAKTERLAALIRRLTRMAVVLDNEVVARGLSDQIHQPRRESLYPRSMELLRMARVHEIENSLRVEVWAIRLQRVGVVAQALGATGAQRVRHALSQPAGHACAGRVQGDPGGMHVVDGPLDVSSARLARARARRLDGQQHAARGRDRR